MGDEKNENWGGRRKGAGRPPMQVKHRKSEKLPVRFTAPEIKELHRRAEAAVKSLSDWVRDRLGLPADK